MWLLLALACGSDPKGDTGPSCGEHTPRLTYSNFGEGVLAKHCTGCHSSLIPVEDRRGAPVGVDLDSLSAARQFADRIVARSVEGDTMPPGGGPSEEERQWLGEWVACGMPE